MRVARPLLSRRTCRARPKSPAMFFPGQSLTSAARRGRAVRPGPVVGARRAGITVNVISPGRTDTDMMQDRYRDTAAQTSPFNRIGDPREVADVAVFLATDAERWVTGQNIGAGGEPSDDVGLSKGNHWLRVVLEYATVSCISTRRREH